MLNQPAIMVLVGAICGFLAGLGVGGGTLLLLWLTLVLGVEQNTARIINLLFFLPTAAISSVFRWRRGDLDLRKVLPAILSGCISAAVFSVIGHYVNTAILKKLFGILLLATGIKELSYRPKN